MRVLIILKYIPSAEHHQKSDLLRTTIDAHVLEDYEVVLLTGGKSASHQWDEIKVKSNILQKGWNAFSRRYLKNTLNLEYRTVVKQVAKYHEKYPIDLIFAECTANYPATYAHAISRVCGIPYIVREHRSYERAFKSINDINQNYLIALRSADAVVAVSPLLAEVMKQYGVGDKIGFLPPALTDKFFSPPEENGAYRQWAGSAILFAGWTRWRDFKRVDLLLEAFNQFIAYGYKAKLIIAGPVEPEENYQWAKQYIEEKGLSDQVWLTGEITRPEIHYLAYDCDCCVVPSDYETFGLPALEAMAAGKPVVTTKCNGPEFVVESNKLGRVVERGSGEELFKGMEDICKNYDQFNQEEIKRSAYERFSMTAVAGQFSALYKNILRAKQR